MKKLLHSNVQEIANCSEQTFLSKPVICLRVQGYNFQTKTAAQLNVSNFATAKRDFV